MPTVGEIARRYGDAYLAKFGDRMPAEQKEVLWLIARCRTGELGGSFYRCEHCGHQLGLITPWDSLSTPAEVFR